MAPVTNHVITVKIGGVDRSDNLLRDSLFIRSSVANGTDVAEFQITGITPSDWDEVTVEVDGTRIFGGYIVQRQGDSVGAGAAKLATGHYARLARTESGVIRLLRGMDRTKDQSYMLHALDQRQLAHALFPLGDLTKAQVRQLAAERGLRVALRAESQDLCFVGDGDYRRFLSRNAPQTASPGPIVDRQGRQLGEHQGLAHYTVGQRRGLGIASGEPLYVVRLDAKTQRVIVGPKSALKTHTVRLRDVNWLGARPLGEVSKGNGAPVEVKVRSTRGPQPAVIQMQGDDVYVTLVSGEYGISPGQACVFYADDTATSEVWGGGFIAEAVPQVFAA